MNQQMNEWMNEWMNRWMNERKINVKVNERSVILPSFGARLAVGWNNC